MSQQTTEQPKILSERMTVNLKLSMAERRLIEELALSREVRFDEIVSDIVHRYLHVESEQAPALTGEQEDLMKDLRKQMRAEYESVWHAVYNED